MQPNNTRQRLQESELHDDFVNLKEKLQEAKGTVEKTASDAKDKAQKTLGNSIKKITQQSKDLDYSVTSYIKENPRTALGLAIAAGILLARIL